MSCVVASVKLNSGHAIPQLGFGTFAAPAGEVAKAVETALATGYRHIDCASFYNNEEEVGVGIAAAIKKHNISREEIFVTSKLWCDKHDPKDVPKACKESLKKLGLQYLDLYLIHWPTAFRFKDEVPFDPFDPSTIVNENHKPENTWKAMELVACEGLVKSIGVSNFNRSQLERILKTCSIRPAVNQVEVNISWPNTKLIEFCQSEDIQIEAYSPLGAPGFRKNKDDIILKDTNVVEIAKKYNRQPAQVLLRHAIQRGLIVLVKSVTEERIKSNFDVFDFDLTEEEIQNLNVCRPNKRLIDPTSFACHKEYPFKDEY